MIQSSIVIVAVIVNRNRTLLAAEKDRVSISPEKDLANHQAICNKLQTGTVDNIRNTKRHK